MKTEPQKENFRNILWYNSVSFLLFTWPVYTDSLALTLLKGEFREIVYFGYRVFKPLCSNCMKIACS